MENVVFLMSTYSRQRAHSAPGEVELVVCKVELVVCKMLASCRDMSLGHAMSTSGCRHVRKDHMYMYLYPNSLASDYTLLNAHTRGCAIRSD